MKRTRKGFTLVELLIVIAIMGVLAAMVSISAGSSTASARAATIYNNIRSIKMAGMMYQVQKGDSFKESLVTQSNLETSKVLKLENYNGTGDTASNITYAIVQGVDATEDAAAKGAYVTCDFSKDADRVAIANALKGYKDIRVGDSTYKAGAYFFHYTSQTTSEEGYEVDDMFAAAGGGGNG